ncbi:MAG: hypothetical protein JO021_24035 [Alphaproteobacteria bacterium]|nr:hypothetical protein [Alphaproteobacteria bacterium]
MIRAFCDWVAASPLSAAIGGTVWIVPLVQTIHLLLIAAMMASALLFSVRLLGFGGRDQTIAEAARRFALVLGVAIPGLAVTGIVLILAEPARELLNPAFAIKMLLLVIGLAASVWAVRRLMRADSAVARWIGAAGLPLWMAVVAAGRWIAYMQEP